MQFRWLLDIGSLDISRAAVYDHSLVTTGWKRWVLVLSTIKWKLAYTFSGLPVVRRDDCVVKWANVATLHNGWR